jgi:hypothetical protein
MLKDLLAIAAQASIGPLRVGQTLSETLRILGSPNHLSFPYDDMFDGWLTYGPADVFVRIVDNNVRSYLIQLHMFKHSMSRNRRISSEVTVRRPRSADLSYERVRGAVADAGLTFKANSAQDIENGMHPLMQFGHGVRFYFLRFGGQDLQLNYVELGNFSDLF